ncbi:MAG: glycerophosphodiester phosphodiesterase family protein [Pseudomonadota bacterium]
MRLRTVLIAIVVIATAVYLFNASWLAPAQSGQPVLLAHRGVHQTFHREGLKTDSCTATMIYPPAHEFIENTLPSMRAAFDAGADIVEFDIHPTTDGHFAVFHDWTLDCRTEGKGVTRTHSLSDLKALDVGYGYSADGGRTYPLRGKGIGLMPTLDDVLTTFPDRRFFIHIKSRDKSEGEKLAAKLRQLNPEQRARLTVYGASEPVEEVKRQLPDLLVGASGALKSCLLGYVATGWFGHVPEACRGRVMLVPLNIAPWLWGWPNRFMARMKSANTAVFILGDYDGGNFSTGVDSAAELNRLPKSHAFGIWTNRIESIAPLLARLGASRGP